MKADIAVEIEALEDMTVAELREKYAEVFGEETRSSHKVFLKKRIAWGVQAREEGGLSERAQRRAAELADETQLRLVAPRSRTEVVPFKPSQDRRLPMPGAVLTRSYRGQRISVTVLDEGFEYGGKVYRSLTAVAKVVTGAHWNGFHFFGLASKGGNR